MPHHRYVRSQAELFEVMFDNTKTVSDFHIINDDLCSVTYHVKNDFLAEGPHSNPILATFTTCWARLKLLDVLHQLDRDVLYFDTDSVIYVERATTPRIPVGDYLGQLTNELEGSTHITQFVSGGPKNYAYKLSDESACCKVKGFTLNYTNSKSINFDAIKNLVLNEPKRVIELPKCTKITRNKRTFQVVNKEETKKYQIVNTKRQKLDNYDSVPYGY